ncbi:MAG: outer membrane lipoprotein-sorting protein, partial [Treponema sp.]|nr:outer membrane lipoprotein-sorting protein [Treponema sp.]
MKKFLALFATAALLASATFAAEDPAKIVDKSVSVTPPEFSISFISFQFYDKNGKLERDLLVDQYGRNRSDLIETVFSFIADADIKNTRLLQAEKKGKQDDKWIFLPSVGTARRVASAERQKSFVGSEFAYDDMSLRHADLDTHVMVNENVTKKVGSATYTCWQIESTPIKKADSGYSKRVQFIDKKTYLPVSVEYFDKKGALLKICSVEEIRTLQGVTGKN